MNEATKRLVGIFKEIGLIREDGDYTELTLNITVGSVPTLTTTEIVTSGCLSKYRKETFELTSVSVEE